MSFINTLTNMKNRFFYILKVTEDFGTDPDPHPDPIVRGTDPDPRIRNKISRIRNTEYRFQIACIALYRRRCIVLYLCVNLKKKFRGPKIDTQYTFRIKKYHKRCSFFTYKVATKYLPTLSF